jgi:hypothetical protein
MGQAGIVPHRLNMAVSPYELVKLSRRTLRGKAMLKF